MKEEKSLLHVSFSTSKPPGLEWKLNVMGITTGLEVGKINIQICLFEKNILKSVWKSDCKGVK